MRLAGREDEIERINLEALRIAREVADETGTLMAGNICNSTVYMKGNEDSIKTVRDMFKVSVHSFRSF